jgi:hypothetical protein
MAELQCANCYQSAKSAAELRERLAVAEKRVRELEAELARAREREEAKRGGE